MSGFSKPKKIVRFSKKKKSEKVSNEGMVEEDDVLEEICMPSSLSVLEGVADWDSSQEEEEKTETVESDGGKKEKENEAGSAGQEWEVGLKSRRRS